MKSACFIDFHAQGGANHAEASRRDQLANNAAAGFRRLHDTLA